MLSNKFKPETLFDMLNKKIIIALTTTLSLFLTQNESFSAEPGANSGVLLQEDKNAPGMIDTTTLPHIMDRSKKPAQDCDTKIKVSKIVIVGNQKLSENFLQNALKKDEREIFPTQANPKLLSLCDFHSMSSDLTNLYHQKGYVLSFAVIPPQQIKNGVLIIRIVEGKIGKVKVTNNSLVSTKFLNDIVNRNLPAGQVLEKAPLEESVYYIRDLSQGEVSPVAAPGEKSGTSDIAMNVKGPDNERFGGSTVSLDDWGNPYTGSERLTGNLNVNDLAGRGDQLSVVTQITGNIFNPGLGPGMEYVQAGYMIPLTTFGTRAGMSFTALNYKIIDTTLANLTGTGTGEIFNVFLNQTFVHRKREDINLRLDYSHYVLSDIFGSGTNTLNDNRNLDVLSLELNGSHRLPGNHKDIQTTASWSINGAIGNVGFTNSQAQAVDSGTLQTGGTFYKVNGTGGTWTYFTGDPKWFFGVIDPNKMSFFFKTSGQLASKNLDPSQQFVLGGPESVASYAEGLLAGSQGALGQIELRYDYVRENQNLIMGKLFYDEGYINVDRFLPIQGPNSAFLGGPGVGIDLKHKSWSGSLAVSVPVGSQPVLVSDNIPGAVSFNPTGSMPIQIWGQVNYKW